MSAVRKMWGVLLLAFVLVLSGNAGAQEREKGKDKGKEKEKEKANVEPGQEATGQVKRFIQAQGFWDKNGFTVMRVRLGGPASQLKSEDGKSTASLQPGDRIVEVEGTKIESASDYFKAMNAARDPKKIKIKVHDGRTGKDQTYYQYSATNYFIQPFNSVHYLLAGCGGGHDA